MYDYVVSLHEAFKKLICPWVTYERVEQAVYWFIQNLFQKCESILMDQLELKLIEIEYSADQFQEQQAKVAPSNVNDKDEDEDPDAQGSIRKNNQQPENNDDKQTWLETDQWNIRIANRLKRIYGSEHENIAAFNKAIQPPGKGTMVDLPDLGDINPMKQLSSLKNIAKFKE